MDALGEFIRDLDVGVLVNNAGACYPYARYFHEVDEALARGMVRLNVEAVTRVLIVETNNNDKFLPEGIGRNDVLSEAMQMR